MSELDETLRELVSEIEKVYVQGCIEFYDRSETNPWGLAYERLEQSLVRGDAPEVAVEEFKREAIRLLKVYRR